MTEYAMWVDRDKKRPVKDKIIAGMEHVLEKYGVLPEVVMVNPAQAIPDKGLGVKLVEAANVNLNTFWIGPIDR